MYRLSTIELAHPAPTHEYETLPSATDLHDQLHDRKAETPKARLEEFEIETRLNESVTFLRAQQSIRRFTGWRFGVISCAGSAILVFLINFITSVWTVSTTKLTDDGRGTLFDGSCT